MVVTELVGIAVAFIVLAGFTVAIMNGSQTASVMKAGADGFATDLRAATLR
jgi:hypothetical protein